MVGNLDSAKVLVFVFAITLLTSLAASTEGGIDQVELEPKTLGPGDEKIVTIANVEDDGGAADGSPDGEDLYINYLTVSNYVPKSSEIPDNVLGSEINTISIWMQGGTLIASNASHQLNSKVALLGSQDGESIHRVPDDSSENLNIKVEMDSNIAVSEDGTGIRLLPKAWATTDGSAFSGHSAGYTPNTSIVDARPEISSASTLDENSNGKIDAVNVSFTESVELSNPEGENDALPGISVGDYNLENHDYNGEKGESHVIHVEEGKDGDTGATPEVSYGEGENTIIDADQLENELRSAGGVTASDGAAPVADVSYENNGSDVNYVDVEFSEAVKSHSSLDSNDWSWNNPNNLLDISDSRLEWDAETPEREFRIDLINGGRTTNLGETTLQYTDNDNVGDGTNSFSGEGSPYSLEDEASPSLIQTADLVAKDKVQVSFSEEVDGAGDDLVAGDFNFTGSQNIQSVSGTGFTRQVNITFSENLESSNLGSNREDGPEGDSVGVKKNSVQDEADNYAELDPVGLRDLQGLIDSNGSTITCDLNVSKSGQSYNSIQNAVDDATTEDSVCVHNGFYKESVDLDKNITLISPDGATLSFPDSTTSGALIDVKAGYSPVISGFRINDSNFQGQEAYLGKGIEIRGDAEPIIRNLNFLDTEDQNNIGHAVDAQGSTGNWKLKDTRITGIDYIGIRALESSGDYVIDNVTVKDSDDHAIEVEKSTGNWAIRDTKINETGGDGIDAHKVSSADIRNVEIYNADLNGINLHDANTSGEIRNVTIKKINNTGAEALYAAINLGNSTGNWKIVESVITNGTGNGVSAWKADDLVNASYNYWGASDGPDGYEGGEDYNSHYTDGSGGDADYNITVQPYYKDEDKTQLSGGDDTKITDLGADFETREEISEDFKGVIIAQLEASSKPVSVSLTIEDSEGNEMTTTTFSQERIEENEGVYNLFIPVPSDEGIYGEHFVEIDSLNGEDVDKGKEVYKTGVFIGSESEEPPEDEPVETVSADDFYTNTTTDYSLASAFVGHILEVTAESGVFSLIDSSNNFEETVNVSKNENFSTSDLEEGRYKLNSSDGNLSEIDIFRPDSDVISRIANVSGPEVRVFDYTRMDEIDLDSDTVNISGPENWQESEHVFRMNTSLDRYWIQIDGDEKTVAEASRTAKQERLERCDGYEDGDEEEELEVESSTEDDDQCIKGKLRMPYVQDFAPEEGFNVSGTVYNKDSQNATVSDLKLKLVKNEFDYRLDERGPLRESPPIITTMTDESGEYTFENVPAAGYNLYVVNDSWAPIKGSQYFDPEIWVTGDMSDESLAVTDKTGKLNLTIDGPQKDFVYGYNLNRVDERGWYSQLGIGAGETNITLPTGEYYVGIGRQSLTGETPSQRSLGKVNVTEDDLTNISASYADTVYLNGSVKQEESILDIDDAYISIRSKGDREQRKGYWTRVEGGEFSRKVAENTNYTVRLSPPYQSSYTDKEKDIEVNESSATLNFSLETGKYIAGEIEANGEPVEARVRVSNSSEGIWRNTETEDGVYNVTGLKNGSYEVSVQPRNPRYTEASKQVTLSGGSNGSLDFELGGSTAVLNGTVSFEGEGSPEGVEVEVEAEDPFVEDREEELGSDGVFSFEVPEDTYYSIEVEGEVDGEEKDKRKTRYISGDETVDFAFETLQKFEGVVKTDSGERVRAWVGARNFSERSRDYTRTGEDGEFELELSKAPHEVVIEPHPSESVGSDKIRISEEDVVDGRNFTYDLSSYTYLQGEVDFQGINSSEGFIAVGNESAESFNYQKLQNGSFNLTGLKDAGHRVFIASRKGNLRKESTIDSPVQIGNEKNFTLGETAKKKVVVRTHSGSDTGPIEPNVTVQTRETEELTNSSGEAVFKVDPRSTTQFYVDKDGFRSNIREITVDGDTSSVREVDVGINQTQEYSVRINVSKEGNSDSDISPPASVVFVSRNNQSAEGGSVTVNTEGARPSIDGLTTGEYLVGVAEGPETEYVNKTAEIPEEDPLSQMDTVKMTDSDGETRYTVWYEVTQ